MTVVYILAHLDDEYGALPLIWEAEREGFAQKFLYLADYRDAALGERRLAETRRFLARAHQSPCAVRPIGLGTGVFDQSVHRGLGELLPRVLAELAEASPITRLVVPAWEGGHMDHDACAFLGARLAAALGVPVRQFSFYNGLGLPRPLLRGVAPLAQNGPVRRLALSPGAWLRWSLAVRAFPSQLYAWSGIWPAMMWGLARRGFGWQALAAERVDARPHAGPLFYERMFKVPYVEVRAALDAALPTQLDAAMLITSSPDRISATPAQ
jgi:hypothetical protein